MTIALPPMTVAQTAGWHALLEVHDQLPGCWTLVGGQMVPAVFERGSTSWNSMLAVTTGQDVSLYAEPVRITTPQGMTVHTDYPMEDPMYEPERAPVR